MKVRASSFDLLHVLIVHSGVWAKLDETLASVFRNSGAVPGVRVAVFFEDEGVALNSNVKYPGVTFFKHGGGKDFFDIFCSIVSDSDATFFVSLQSGECFFPYSFEAVRSIFNMYDDVFWLTGIQTLKTRAGFNIPYGSTPNRRWSYSVFDRHFYKQGNRNISVASTFWKKNLWCRAMHQLQFISETDFYDFLWLQFFKIEPLYTCTSYFSSSPLYIDESQGTFLSQSMYAVMESGWLKNFLELSFIRNVPYFRKFYRKANNLTPVVRFDYIKQNYFLSNY